MFVCAIAWWTRDDDDDAGETWDSAAKNAVLARFCKRNDESLRWQRGRDCGSLNIVFEPALGFVTQIETVGYPEWPKHSVDRMEGLEKMLWILFFSSPCSFRGGEASFFGGRRSPQCCSVDIGMNSRRQIMHSFSFLFPFLFAVIIYHLSFRTSFT